MKNKSLERIEKKKKKMAALLEITHLNDYDKNLKKLQMKEATSLNACELEPEVKKPRIESNTNKHCELGPSGKPKLSGLELQELKKLLRERTTKIKQQPYFKLRDVGTNASLQTELENRVPLFYSDLQHLIMYSQLGHHSPYSPARWCALDKFNKLSMTCILIVENLALYDFINNETLFPFLSSTFENKLEVLVSNESDIVKDLSMVALTGTQVKKYRSEFGSLQNAVYESLEVFDTVRYLFPIEKTTSEESQDLPTTDAFPRTQLLLSGWQMVEENFPLPIRGLMERKYCGYVLTKDNYEHVTPFSKMFGIDCEMCKTTIGDLELTRISVVDEQLNTFYDTLVKPDNKIVDYLTKFSGITPKMMKNIRTTLHDVQQDLRRLLPADAILVGQSLGNDLHALKMMHPYVIDTSVIFNLTGERCRKTKLKTLAHEFLAETIQEGRLGHCSTEDSLASLKLAQLKLTKNLYFGDAVMGNVYADVRSYPELGTFNYATSMLRQITKFDKTAQIVAGNSTVLQYKHYVDKGLRTPDKDEKIRFFVGRSSKDVVNRLYESMNNCSLSIGHLKVPNDGMDDARTLKSVDDWVKGVYGNMSMSGLLIVAFAGRKSANGVCFIQLKRDV